MSAIALCVTILLALVTAASAQPSTTFRDASGRITGTVTRPSSTTLARRVPPLSQGPFNAQKLSEPLMISEP